MTGSRVNGKKKGKPMKNLHPLAAVSLGGMLALACVISAHGQTKPGPQRTDSAAYSIANCVNEFKKDKIEKTDAGYQYWFVDKMLADGKTLKMSVVKPHAATHAPHQHPEEEFFFV
jgi:hypothetical protein